MQLTQVSQSGPLTTPISVFHSLSTNCFMYVAYVHVHTCAWIYEELNDPLKLTMEGSNDDLEEEDENVGAFQVL